MSWMELTGGRYPSSSLLDPPGSKAGLFYTPGTSQKCVGLASPPLRGNNLTPPLLFCRTMSFTMEMPVLCLCYWGISGQLEINPRAQVKPLMFLGAGQLKVI